VNLLRERNNVEIEKLRLFQQLGVPQPADVRLATSFPVSEPAFKLDEMLTMARKSNPSLESQRYREKSASLSVRQAQSAYFPSIGFQTSIAGYTQQLTNLASTIAGDSIGTVQSRASCLTQDSIRVGAGLSSIKASRCDPLVFTEADKAAIRAANSKYPFDMTRSPITFSVGLSLPIFDGLQREQRIQLATADRNDARYRLRDVELRLTAEVTAAYLNLMTAYRTVVLQEQNAQAARDALNLAQERFRVGASSFVDVTQSRSDYETASTTLITAIYDFHKAFATLENAIGRPLR
jgi:outer membrane protein